jgi:hypothetical protein
MAGKCTTKGRHRSPSQKRYKTDGRRVKNNPERTETTARSRRRGERV